MKGRVERFTGRVSSEGPGIPLYSPRDLEQGWPGFHAAENARRQRVLDGKTPKPVVAQRLTVRRKLAKAESHGRAGPDDISQARLMAEAAKEVSQPDTLAAAKHCVLSATMHTGHLTGDLSQFFGCQQSLSILRQRVPIIPRHPTRRLHSQFPRVALQFGEVFEGVDTRKFARVNEAHEEIADFGSLQSAIKQRIFPIR